MRYTLWPLAAGGGIVNLFSVPVQGTDSDERYTPRWVFDGLGLMFDLDPASPLEGGDSGTGAKSGAVNFSTVLLGRGPQVVTAMQRLAATYGGTTKVLL